ncbi:MAG: phosphoenolpyruvate carboxylase [Alphaproteobacteria bacterium]
MAGTAAPNQPSGPASHPERAAAPGDPAALHARLRGLLAEFRESGHVDPFGNPISRMALELTRMADRGEIGTADLDALVQHMSASAFAARAARMAAYLETTDPDENAARLRAVLERVARPEPDGPAVPFETFRAAVESLHFGVVFTAHPTFALPIDLARALSSLAGGADPDAALTAARRGRHRPPVRLTLDDEFAWAMEAIGHAQDALSRVHAVALAVARSHYPEDWRRLAPRLVSIASWVGYDHDGRSDIGWTDTLGMRLKVKLAQLARLRDASAALRAEYPATPAAPTLELIESILALAAKQVEYQIEASALDGGDEPRRAATFARRLVEGREHALTDCARLAELLDRAVAAAGDDALAARLCSLRAALATNGLGVAHTHFRLNATQLHNAIRRQIGLHGDPADPAQRRSYLNAINELLADARPASVNIGSLLAERASARRMFMMIAALAKHIDAATPIRFLIAETETAFTLLVALYFARVFGVEHLVEISPLFETEEAMEHGDRLVEDALRSPHFKAYVRRTGRLCLQFGFSDSGRYVGQMAATFWIERLRLKIAAALARHGLAGVQVVLFSTHGESVGRGGHPSRMTDRLRYVAPPVSRAAFAEAGVSVKEESSFQGGDGYLWFLSPETAFATLCRVAEFALEPDAETTGDPIYEDPDFAAEFFAVVHQEFAHTVEDPDYAALLGVFGTNMLDRTGSRPVRRQHEATVGPKEFLHPSQMRAIPNNAVLQQLGLLANTIGGLGRAAAKDLERFRLMLRASPRFRRAMAMVAFAASASDLDVLRAYVDTLDPGVWLNRSARTRNPARRDELRFIAMHLERGNALARLLKIFRRLQADQLLLRDILADAEADDALPVGGLDAEAQAELALLHAVRVALIHRIYLLGSHIPEFSPFENLTRADLVQLLVHLDVDQAVEVLKQVFPRRDAAALRDLDFAEPATYVADAAQTYEQEHVTLFEPIAAHMELIRRLAGAITHRIGALG